MVVHICVSSSEHGIAPSKIYHEIVTNDGFTQAHTTIAAHAYVDVSAHARI